MSNLIIASSTIRQDSAGRYSLNDLHRAAGGEQRHRPSRWVENQQTRDLAAELEGEAGIPALLSIHGGTAPGTYAARELVFAYAMWISPAFHLAVIRAYDALVAARTDPLAVLNDPAALRGLLASYAAREEGLQQVIADQAPKVEALDRIATARGDLCLTDAAKALQMRRTDLINWMQEHGWIYKRGGTNWIGYQPKINDGLLVHKVVTRGNGVEERLFDQVLVTPRGLAKLAVKAREPRAAVAHA
ncbi:phage antirepressor KilAC domain-containing protein [Pseudoxanthomonas winnipegensis]|uniref:phage antirepressor KilAC domain-containing protein n=1 Tax=Pseudoxanthomonas winnipegensis TaxID=2480810 RepID=UPI0013EF3ADA|nr:phage antirepressor KilAC domain-containing protein [Pseudoxanthomonas winnipegensis]